MQHKQLTMKMCVRFPALVAHRRAQRAYEADTTQRPWYRSPPRFPVTPDEGRVGHNVLLLLGKVYLIRVDQEAHSLMGCAGMNMGCSGGGASMRRGPVTGMGVRYHPALRLGRPSGSG